MTYTTNIQNLADRVVNGGVIIHKAHTDTSSIGYDPTMGLIKGGFVGGCGFQPEAYDVMDGNFLSGHGLRYLYPTISATILSNSAYWLGQGGYHNNDRRETIFQMKVGSAYTDIFDTSLVQPPPYDTVQICAGGVPTTTPFIIEAIPNANTKGTDNMNTLVPTALNAYMYGRMDVVNTLYQQTLSWWNGIGFMDAGAISGGNFASRELSYWLIMVRALSISSPIESAVEARLWAQQRSEVDNGIIGDYNFDGSQDTSFHCSNESNGLTLIAYDPNLPFNITPPLPVETSLTLTVSTFSHDMIMRPSA